MTDEQIKEIRARADAATYGKWRHLKPQVGASTADGGRLFSSVWSGQFDIGGGMLARDAEFIAYAREDVPALCDALAAANQRIAELVKLLRDIDDENNAAKGMQDAALYSSGSDLDLRVRKALAGGAS